MERGGVPRLVSVFLIPEWSRAGVPDGERARRSRCSIASARRPRADAAAASQSLHRAPARRRAEQRQQLVSRGDCALRCQRRLELDAVFRSAVQLRPLLAAEAAVDAPTSAGGHRSAPQTGTRRLPPTPLAPVRPNRNSLVLASDRGSPRGVGSRQAASRTLGSSWSVRKANLLRLVSGMGMGDATRSSVRCGSSSRMSVCKTACSIACSIACSQPCCFTDIVASTQTEASLGDRGWKRMLGQHHGLIREELMRWRGSRMTPRGTVLCDLRRPGTRGPMAPWRSPSAFGPSGSKCGRASEPVSVKSSMGSTGGSPCRSVPGRIDGGSFGGAHLADRAGPRGGFRSCVRGRRQARVEGRSRRMAPLPRHRVSGESQGSPRVLATAP
jgi:hypothetical protein